jgi:hypothetical protein
MVQGHCVGFKRVPESIRFAESAKLVREFVHQRSSPHVATEATGVAGGLEKRNVHRLRAKLPRSPSHVKKSGKIAVISASSRTFPV